MAGAGGEKTFKELWKQEKCIGRLKNSTSMISKNIQSSSKLRKKSDQQTCEHGVN